MPSKALVYETSRMAPLGSGVDQPFQHGSRVSTFQEGVEWEAFLDPSVTSFAGNQLPLIAINTSLVLADF